MTVFTFSQLILSNYSHWDLNLLLRVVPVVLSVNYIAFSLFASSELLIIPPFSISLETFQFFTILLIIR